MKKNLLRAELAKAGMTQAELAAQMGMLPQTLGRQINTGKMGLERAEEICRLLKIDRSRAVEIFLPGI